MTLLHIYILEYSINLYLHHYKTSKYKLLCSYNTFIYVMLNHFFTNFKFFYCMKKIFWILFNILLVQIIATINFVDVHSNNSSAPLGYTGSPNENNSRTCSSQNGGCHSGSGTTFQSDMISINIPDCGYIPGETYSVTLTVSSIGRNEFGFSVSPQFSDGLTAGTMIASSGTQLNGSGRYLTHTSAGTIESSPNTRVWTFDWIAPQAGSGNVVFYAAFNASNNNDSSTGDLIFNSNLTIFEGTQPDVPAIFGNNINCLGSPAVLSTNYANSIVWQPGNETSQDIEVLQAGTYQVFYSNECGSSLSEPFEVSFEPLPPQPSILFNASTASLECSESGTYLYSWYLNGELLIDSVSSSIVPSQLGDYTLVISSFNGCSSEASEVFSFQSMNAEDLNNERKLHVFPNPASTYIELENSKNIDLPILIFDEVGRLVLNRLIKPGKNPMFFDLPSGVYTLSLSNKATRLLVVR